MPAEPLTGRLAVHGLYVKFENGVVNVSHEETVQMMLNHPGFNKDYISTEESGGADPYKNTRQENEPVHQITEMQYGHMGKTINAPTPISRMSVDTQRTIMQIAESMAKEMAPKIAVEILKNIAAQKKEPEKVVEAPKEESAVLESSQTQESGDAQASSPEISGDADKKPAVKTVKFTKSSK